MTENLPTELSFKKERRFVPATNEQAQKRLTNFRNEIKNLQEKHPEVLGATIYGSMIKGEQTNENSDIDAFLYIDVETLSKTGQLNDPEALKTKYRSELLKDLEVSENKSLKYYEDVRIQLLSERIIDDNINLKIEYEKEKEVYKKMMQEKYTYETSLDEKEKLLSQEPAFKNMDFGIQGMFHARIGAGIQKYRHLFLEKINNLTDKKIASEIWKGVYYQLSLMENRSDSEKKIEIPTTLTDAIRIYHPDLYKDLSRQRDEEKITEIKERLRMIALKN